jgi:hypothetical protein
VKTKFEHGEESDRLVIEIEPDDEYCLDFKDHKSHQLHFIRLDYDDFADAYDQAMWQKLEFMAQMKRGPDTERYYYEPNKRG